MGAGLNISLSRESDELPKIERDLIKQTATAWFNLFFDCFVYLSVVSTVESIKHFLHSILYFEFIFTSSTYTTPHSATGSVLLPIPSTIQTRLKLAIQAFYDKYIPCSHRSHVLCTANTRTRTWMWRSCSHRRTNEVWLRSSARKTMTWLDGFGLVWFDGWLTVVCFSMADCVRFGSTLFLSLYSLLCVQWLGGVRMHTQHRERVRKILSIEIMSINAINVQTVHQSVDVMFARQCDDDWMCRDWWMLCTCMYSWTRGWHAIFRSSRWSCLLLLVGPRLYRALFQTIFNVNAAEWIPWYEWRTKRKIENCDQNDCGFKTLPFNLSVAHYSLHKHKLPLAINSI